MNVACSATYVIVSSDSAVVDLLWEASCVSESTCEDVYHMHAASIDAR